MSTILRARSFRYDEAEGGGEMTSKGDGLLRSNLPLWGHHTSGGKLLRDSAKEMACENEMACCVSGYHVYKDICVTAAIGEVLACSREQTNAEKFRCKKYIGVKYFRPFSWYENISTTKYTVDGKHTFCGCSSVLGLITLTVDII